MTEAVTLEYHFLDTGIVQPGEHGLVGVALLIEFMAEEQGEEHQQDDPGGNRHAFAYAAGILLLRCCHARIVNQSSLVHEPQARKHMAVVGLEKITEAGALDGWTGVQAATLEGIVKIVKPGL